MLYIKPYQVQQINIPFYLKASYTCKLVIDSFGHVALLQII